MNSSILAHPPDEHEEINMKPSIFSLFLLSFTIAWHPALARELKIVFLQYTPPYVLDQERGISIDLMREALKPRGYEIVPVTLPIGRGYDLFAKGRADGTANILESSGLPIHYSDDFIRYHNKVFTLKTSHQTIKKISDLKEKKIAAFQNARKYLGDEFNKITVGNFRYREMSNQEKQTLLLLNGGAEVAVMDESVFHFFRGKLVAEGKVSPTVEVDTFTLFPPTLFKAAFIDKKVRDEFNRGLADLRRSGRFDAIYREYLEEYFSVKQ
jgi:polar amino acid transport system substrate-binding protein